MKTYDVHLFFAIRIKVANVDAESQEDAIEKASERVCVTDYLRDGAEDDESAPLGALVDEHGDTEYLNTRYYEGMGARNYLKTDEELE